MEKKTRGTGIPAAAVPALILALVPALLLAPLLHPIRAAASEKQTVYNSPHVTFSPDGRAWTTNAGDRNYVWYDSGTAVTTGTGSSLRGLDTGEHYYERDREGEIPVGRWEVTHRTGTCCHDAYPAEDDDYHGIGFRRQNCLGYYYSGWTAFCADCGESITDMLMYMSREAAESIDYLDAGRGLEYYYLCPLCTNLEQGAWLEKHKCKAVSRNRYRVVYDVNTDYSYSGYMADSFHMYNNAAEYEGEPVTPVTRLTRNAYARTGYMFTGWNTEPDGSGTAFTDGQEIFNLTAENAGDGDESGGTVTLYARWQRSSSTLVIDAGEGLYGGLHRQENTEDYGQRLPVSSGLVEPPSGHTVSFETNGGNAVAPVTGTMHFTEWEQLQPFGGRFRNDTYFFMAPDGTRDTIRAVYAADGITLPGADRPGYSFGGWYYDTGFKRPAGGSGTVITPASDLTLYAQWVDLRLQALDNYTAFGGAGAVDLSWKQADGRNKAYLLYRSRDGAHWTRISTAEDVSSGTVTEQTWNYTGTVRTWTVPLSGFYTLTAEGARGGSWGSARGGAGGRVTGRFWLSAGERLTVQAGGTDGYNGGGTATMYGSGGGCTTVTSDRKGLLLTAGGGGGASAAGNGGAGGSSAGLGGTPGTGQTGGAGGGGGYLGGLAGEYILHSHQAPCHVSGISRAPQSFWEGCEIHAPWGNVKSDRNGQASATGVGSPGQITSPWLPTASGTSLQFSVEHDNWNGIYDTRATVYGMRADGSTAVLLDSYNMEKSQEIVSEWTGEQNCGQCGKKKKKKWRSYSGVFSGIVYRADEHGNDYHRALGEDNITGTYTVPIPPDVIQCRIVISGEYDGGRGTWTTIRLYDVKYAYAYTVCGYREGDIESARPSYGGSSYVNTAYATAHTATPGCVDGNGSASLRSEMTGFQETLSLKGVTAGDEAAPEKIAEETVRREAAGERIRISWSTPADRGTDYYHRAESYPAGGTTLLCSSNVTRNTLTSGIRGYYVVTDNSPGTAAGPSGGTYTALRETFCTLTGSEQYLHIAPVDVAGNLGETLHVSIGSTVTGDEVAWPLYTRQLVMEEGENVYPAQAAKTWYVRSDGSTPFTLRYGAYLQGTAGASYQITRAVLTDRTGDGSGGDSILHVPCSPLTDGTVPVNGELFDYATEGQPLLGSYPYVTAERSGRNRELAAVRKFTLGEEHGGRSITVIPGAGADFGEERITSDPEADRANAITLIGDGTPPEISGLELPELTDRTQGSIHLNIRAEDDLSGVGDFYVTVTNTDNYIEKTYTPDGNGIIGIDITRDIPLFSGDFTVRAYAEDNVGNVSETVRGTTEFALTASVERILEPHDPVFKRGESGILTVTSWGYADRVEVTFPEEMTALAPELNRTFVYTDTPRYVQEERVQFMIPLYAPENANFSITVTAYKEGRRLDEYPAFSIISVDGSILDEIRTRLR